MREQELEDGETRQHTFEPLQRLFLDRQSSGNSHTHRKRMEVDKGHVLAG